MDRYGDRMHDWPRNDRGCLYTDGFDFKMRKEMQLKDLYRQIKDAFKRHPDPVAGVGVQVGYPIEPGRFAVWVWTHQIGDRPFEDIAQEVMQGLGYS